MAEGTSESAQKANGAPKKHGAKKHGTSKKHGAAKPHGSAKKQGATKKRSAAKKGTTWEGTKTAFILDCPKNMTAEDVVAEGKKVGLKFKIGFVYSVRSRHGITSGARKKRKKAKKADGASASLSDKAMKAAETTLATVMRQLGVPRVRELVEFIARYEGEK
jgi:hypothetical protein